MTLKEALEDIIAHPLKRALKMSGDGLVYYDKEWDEKSLRASHLGQSYVFGFGIASFSTDDALSSHHEVIDVDIPSLVVPKDPSQ